MLRQTENFEMLLSFDLVDDADLNGDMHSFEIGGKRLCQTTQFLVLENIPINAHGLALKVNGDQLLQKSICSWVQRHSHDDVGFQFVVSGHEGCKQQGLPGTSETVDQFNATRELMELIKCRLLLPVVKLMTGFIDDCLGLVQIAVYDCKWINLSAHVDVILIQQKRPSVLKIALKVGDDLMNVTQQVNSIQDLFNANVVHDWKDLGRTEDRTSRRDHGFQPWAAGTHHGTNQISSRNTKHIVKHDGPELLWEVNTWGLHADVQEGFFNDVKITWLMLLNQQCIELDFD